jgi:hypothetical protein
MYKSQADAVKEWLQAYVANEKRIDKQLDELRTLKARMMSVGAQQLSDMPRPPSSGKDRMADYVIRVEKLEASIQGSIDIQEDCKKAIEKMIMDLEKPEERLIIRYRYLYGMEWSEVMDFIYKKEEQYLNKIESYRRRMYRVHEDALNKMAKGWGKNAGATNNSVVLP